MKKKKTMMERPSDPRLNGLIHLLRHPLHKLVPSGHIGYPGYNADGTECRDEEGKHLSVVCGVYGYQNLVRRTTEWNCHITITDGDDFVLSRTRPFTLENWTEMHRIYTELDFIDGDYLTMEDFR